jgi:quinol monooxygenase YgiN
MTFFGGMTSDDEARELGGVNLLGRWSCVGEGRGYCVAQASNNVVMQRWLNNWVTMADIRVTPCLDDNQHRELVLGSAPSFRVAYDGVGNNARDGESLYFVRYQFREGCRDKGFQAFANMTQEQDTADSGACTSYGRWHVPSQGCGYAIASSPSAEAIYRWAYNWNSLCDVVVSPVTCDSDTRSIIRHSPGFQVKHDRLMEEMRNLQGPTGPCHINAKFIFKDRDNKQKFMDILNGPDGIIRTREFEGCESVECFQSQENELEFNIRQKWSSVAEHESYMQMRKESGLFDSVTEMLSSPFEVTHLTILDC